MEIQSTCQLPTDLARTVSYLLISTVRSKEPRAKTQNLPSPSVFIFLLTKSFAQSCLGLDFWLCYSVSAKEHKWLGDEKF